MTIGFRASSKITSVLGKLSGFNVWTYALLADEILRMSHGCGDEAGDSKAWKTVKEGLKKDVRVQWNLTCNDIEGESPREFKQYAVQSLKSQFKRSLSTDFCN